MVGQSYRVQQIVGNPDRQIAGGRGFGVDPKWFLLAPGRDEFNAGWVFLARILECLKSFCGEFCLAGRQWEDGQATTFPAIASGTNLEMTFCVTLRLVCQLFAGSFPFILRVRPGDDFGQMQVLGLHQQVDVFHRAMDVEVSCPPTLLRHIDKTFHFQRFGVGAPAFHFEVTALGVVLGTTFHLKCIITLAKSELDRGAEDKMVFKKGHFRCHSRAATGVF